MMYSWISSRRFGPVSAVDQRKKGRTEERGEERTREERQRKRERGGERGVKGETEEGGETER